MVNVLGFHGWPGASCGAGQVIRQHGDHLADTSCVLGAGRHICHFVGVVCQVVQANGAIRNRPAQCVAIAPMPASGRIDELPAIRADHRLVVIGVFRDDLGPVTNRLTILP
ncbi:MAG: hypothetical protein K8T89_22020 [Planctomycetes bacterium]|nr:hypothetical protein [Planctomycetota bacterium]